jgi:hypothetical protein
MVTPEWRGVRPLQAGLLAHVVTPWMIVPPPPGNYLAGQLRDLVSTTLTVPRHTKRITTTVLRKFFFVFHLEELQVIKGPKEFETTPSLAPR